MTLPSEAGRRVSKAQELAARGKHKRAIEELWFAESIARGDADALTALLGLATALGDRAGWRGRPDFAELIQVLTHDFDSTTRPSTASTGTASDSVHAPRHEIALSETCIVLATVVGIGTWLHLKGGASIMCSVGQVFRGANIGHGLSVAVGGGLLVSILLPLARTSPDDFSVVLLLGVLTLGGAIAFVAADSATWQASQECGSLLGVSETQITEHVYYLYGLWGLPLLVLAYEAASASACKARARETRVC